MPSFEAGNHPMLSESGIHAGPVDQHEDIVTAATSKPAVYVDPSTSAISKAEGERSREPSPKTPNPSLNNEEPDPAVKLPASILCGKLDEIAQSLQTEIGRLPMACTKSISPRLDRQIESIRHLLEDVERGLHARCDDDGKNKTESLKQVEETLVCEVKRGGLDEWHKEQLKPQRGPAYVIEAYYRSLPILDEMTENQRRGTGHMDRQEQPHRVVIDSEVLTAELEDVTGITIMAPTPAIFASPYKMLIRYYPNIAERVSNLESQMARLKREDGSTTSGLSGSPEMKPSLVPGVVSSGRGSGQDNPSISVKTATSGEPGEESSTSDNRTQQQEQGTRRITELATRIDHLRLLKDLIEMELAPSIGLCQRIKDGVVEKIAFEDLWFLFQPGDMLYFKSHSHDQLGKAYAVTGGQQRKRSRTKEEVIEMGGPMPRINDPENDIPVIHQAGRGTWTPLIVDYYTMEFDGYHVGPVCGRRQIRHYAGERKITDLPVYPLRFHKKREEMIQQLTARGKMYCSSYGHKSYRGSTTPIELGRSPEEIQGDIYVDFQDYYRTLKPDPMNPSRRPRRQLGWLPRTSPDIAEAEDVVSGDTWTICDHEVDEKAAEDFLSAQQPDLEPVKFDLFVQSEENLPLFPHHVPAYVFRSRKYVHVDVSLVAAIDKSEEARDSSFKDLVIPDSHRNILIGLVKNQMGTPNENIGPDPVDNAFTQIDIVRGKGRGLIILLHGPPGSGKTSTAETLAAYTRRPLYPITCGDLGTHADMVERSLIEHSERAQRWGCILLLDEADVFLSRRDWRDTNHNALVSVFLRQLEYYSGILILTTNRVGVLDEAFKSRIHVSLAYPTIELEATLNIWDGILKRIDRDNKTATVKIKFDREALLSFAENHYKSHSRSKTAWNGRQIRNAFQLAIALGHHDRDNKLKKAGLTAGEAAKSGHKKWMVVRLTVDNFRNIAKTARDFEDYLHATRGHDSTIAKHMALRHDESPDEFIETPSRSARKDYGQQRRRVASREISSGRERASSFLDPGRNRQRTRELQASSGSRSQRRGRASRGEEDMVEEKEEADEEEIFEQFSSDSD
ncbi:hypothetical protein CEP54_012700 [Fusarium duplospermum]|uniref:AAA+ ATPase domain-containing protein n=1 Tax=Fusarium duplospermum TaxID=1325734 RepID=A0A428P763_9HYPO|nr:hypothetical protein CEP54_012700 [Fusarium duplospermum]